MYCAQLYVREQQCPARGGGNTVTRVDLVLYCRAQLYASSNALPVFKTLVASLIAVSAAVPASYVSVVSVAAGSVITTTLMTFPAGSNYNTAQVWNCVGGRDADMGCRGQLV